MVNETLPAIRFEFEKPRAPVKVAGLVSSAFCVRSAGSDSTNVVFLMFPYPMVQFLQD
jgi:hypothetical protein